MTQHPVVIVPGLGGSGPAHWQTLWESLLPTSTRIEMADWEDPDPATWVAALDAAVGRCAAPPILVAHSLGCAVVARWAQSHARQIERALLVSPSDVDSPAHTPDVVRAFAPMPLARLPFRSTVVASTDDPYVAIERARHFAAAWGGELVTLERAGHINADSGLGSWPAGLALIEDAAA
jgi:predicted alpha/beta hydrolase family esterase